MIVAAVVCPHPPLLFRELSGAQDGVPELRAACRDALVAAVARCPDTIVVIGGAEDAKEWDPSLPVVVRPFGTTTAPHVTGLPLSLGVGKRLLDEVGWDGNVRYHSLSWDAGTCAVEDLAEAVDRAEGRVALLVLADGSRGRWERPPVYVTEHARAYDAAVRDALAEGDPVALAALNTELDDEPGDTLAVHGRAAFAVLGQVVRTLPVRPRARVLYRDAPHEVEYTVAVWDLSE